MTRTTDPELAAMTTIVRALADLDADTRERVLRWANNRYAPPLQAIEAPGDPARTRPPADLAGHVDGLIARED